MGAVTSARGGVKKKQGVLTPKKRTLWKLEMWKTSESSTMGKGGRRFCCQNR